MVCHALSLTEEVVAFLVNRLAITFAQLTRQMSSARTGIRARLRQRGMGLGLDDSKCTRREGSRHVVSFYCGF